MFTKKGIVFQKLTNIYIFSNWFTILRSSDFFFNGEQTGIFFCKPCIVCAYLYTYKVLNKQKKDTCFIGWIYFQSWKIIPINKIMNAVVQLYRSQEAVVVMMGAGVVVMGDVVK